MFRNTETYSSDLHTFRPYVSDFSYLVILDVYLFSYSIGERRVLSGVDGYTYFWNREPQLLGIWFPMF